MRLESKRLASAPRYLELIWRTDIPRHPQDRIVPDAVAYITDIYGTPRDPWYCGYYGIHEVSGPTVAAVKEQLFSLIESGQ